MIEQHDYMTVNYSVISKLCMRDVKKPRKVVCFIGLQRQHRQKTLTVEKYCMHNLGKDQ